jgi:hypothetical protein
MNSVLPLTVSQQIDGVALHGWQIFSTMNSQSSASQGQIGRSECEGLLEMQMHS